MSSLAVVAAVKFESDARPLHFVVVPSCLWCGVIDYDYPAEDDTGKTFVHRLKPKADGTGTGEDGIAAKNYCHKLI